MGLAPARWDCCLIGPPGRPALADRKNLLLPCCSKIALALNQSPASANFADAGVSLQERLGADRPPDRGQIRGVL